MGNGNPVEPTDPERIKAFALFFRRYMSISSVVVAALPIPVTEFKLIPTFEAQTDTLSTYTSLFCFLLMGFVFYSRHQLARLMFPEHFGSHYVFKIVRAPRSYVFHGMQSLLFTTHFDRCFAVLRIFVSCSAK